MNRESRKIAESRKTLFVILRLSSFVNWQLVNVAVSDVKKICNIYFVVFETFMLHAIVEKYNNVA